MLWNNLQNVCQVFCQLATSKSGLVFTGQSDTGIFHESEFRVRKPYKCILRLEKNKFNPPVPCFSPEINQYPEVSEDRPNCYIGGWAWTNTHFTSGWSLLTEHVQQVDYESCENGLGTPIKESELCVVGTSSNLVNCNIF